MYPTEELNRLANRKMVLQARIAVRRWESAQAAAELARPLALVDRGLEMWRRVAPFVKVLLVPGGLLLAKVMKSKRDAHGGHGGKLSIFLGALPAILQGITLFQQMRAKKAASKKESEAAAAGVSSSARSPAA